MTWKAINDTLNRHKTKSRFPETFKQSNEKIISNPKEIATSFNDYFISIGEMGAVTEPPNCHFRLFKQQAKMQSTVSSNYPRQCGSNN